MPTSRRAWPVALVHVVRPAAVSRVCGLLLAFGVAACGSTPETPVQVAPAAKTDEAGDTLAAAIAPKSATSIAEAVPASVKRSALSPNEVAEVLNRWLPEAAAVAPGDLHAWDNPQLKMRYRGQIVVSAIATLEAERAAGRCAIDCLSRLATAYGFFSGMHDLDRATASALLGDAEDREFTAFTARLLEESPTQLRSVLADMLRDSPRARPTLNALGILKVTATREQQNGLVEKIERYIMTIDPHPAIEHQLVIALACYRDLRPPCARSAIAEIKHVESATGEQPSISYDTLQRYDDEVTALSALAGRTDLSSLLRKATIEIDLKRLDDARATLRAAQQAEPLDARAYLALAKLEHDNYTYLQLFQLVAAAGRENRPLDLYTTVGGLWIGGTLRAFQRGEDTTPWLAGAARARELTDDGVKQVAAKAAAKASAADGEQAEDASDDEALGETVPPPVAALGLAIDTVAAVVRGNVPETQSEIAAALARTADTWDYNELRLRLVLAALDALQPRAAKTIAVAVKRDTPGAVALARSVQLVRGIQWNRPPMLVALERELNRLPSRTDAENVLLLDLRAARSFKAPPMVWKKIADAYRALPPAELSEREKTRRAHNLAVAEWKSHPRLAPYAVDAPLPPEGPQSNPVFGPGMLGVVCRQKLAIDLAPLVDPSVHTDVAQLDAEVWLVER